MRGVGLSSIVVMFLVAIYLCCSGTANSTIFLYIALIATSFIMFFNLRPKYLLLQAQIISFTLAFAITSQGDFKPKTSFSVH